MRLDFNGSRVGNVFLAIWSVYFCGGLYLEAAQEWEKVVYSAPNYILDEKVPRPMADWRISEQQKVVEGNPISRVEDVVGINAPRVFWLTKKYVIESPKGMEASAYPREGGLNYSFAMPTQPNISWTKGIEPTKRIMENDVEVLVFDRKDLATPLRAWVAADTGQLIALARDQTVLLFRFVGNVPELRLPSDIDKVLKDQIGIDKAATTMGAMPLPPR